MTSTAPCEKRVQLVVERSLVEFYRVEIKTGQEGQQAFMHAPWHSFTPGVLFSLSLRCIGAAKVARVPKLGQPPQTLDAARAHLGQSSAQLLEPIRADLAKPADTTPLRVDSHAPSPHDANEPMLARKREREDASPSRTLVAQLAKSLSNSQKWGE